MLSNQREITFCHLMVTACHQRAVSFFAANSRMKICLLSPAHFPISILYSYYT